MREIIHDIYETKAETNWKSLVPTIPMQITPLRVFLIEWIIW
jgi:hypothetical protein